MDVIRIVLLNLVIINILLWINHEILHIFRFKKRVLLYSLGGGAVAALLLLLYANVSYLLPGEWTLQQGHTIMSFIPLGVFVAIVLLISWNPWKKHYLNTIILTILLIIAIYLLIGYSDNTTIQVTGGYFLLIAYAEEHLKLIGVRNQSNTLLIKKSDLILCGIISGLGFAFIESIAVSSTVVQSIGRFPLFFVHAIFTSYIAYGLYKSEQNNFKRLSPLILVSVIVVHTLYNIGATSFSSISWIVLSLALYGLYIIITNQTDTLYYQSSQQEVDLKT